jgi:phosphatidylserine/phosphatidylglycerophosphate/cardiolipin synthase-like enzyme
MLLTDLSPLNVAQGATSPEAIQSLIEAFPQTTVHHLPRLHAKVYVADLKQAIVTSGNLTAGGLDLNYEYGLVLYRTPAVEVIRNDITEYAGLGAAIGLDRIATYRQVAEQTRAAFRKQQRTVSRSARKLFEEALSEADDALIKLRIAEGPLHTVFARTVLYLLRREGPLTTEQLHPRVQEIHPDLCDDSVDRVINGVRFGKKWKHAVRTAQQQLKKRELVELQDGVWRLSD